MADSFALRSDVPYPSIPMLRGGGLMPADRLSAEADRPRVLVVDDSPALRLMLADLLTAAGYQVILADDGDVALTEVRRHRPDVVLTDLNMPRMHGLHFIAALQADPSLAALPVLVLTSEDGERKRALAPGVQGWIVKPFEPAELLEALWSLERLEG